ncbi:ABC transporter permease [Sphingobium sp. H39-3-25]|uniref:ABC transporter permease n=1 Tax=Sphingobium arseniciresistens TaxID=3030834 RepID=UPI0023BA143F|nr:ABC transporter permease [Sphingobium arseniciresistens]
MNVWRAALVIARRDYTAVIFSKAFILFLVGPLFPLLIGVVAGNLGERMGDDAARPLIALAMAPADAGAIEGARARLVKDMGEGDMPNLIRHPQASDPRTLLAASNQKAVLVLSGTLRAPVLTGPERAIEKLRGAVAIMASVARAGGALPPVAIQTQVVKMEGGAAPGKARLVTGRGAQVLMFMLTMLLAGMVLSNMVEEKTNKVIEVLAAAVPVDAIFLGKLMAMLAMSLTGIAVWGSAAAIGIMLVSGGGAGGLPAPAVGWPLFALLGILYFATAYTLLGSLFLGIGAQASTVREVQTLSMPVTMMQLVVFFFASYSVDRMGSAQEVGAAIFPFSSPFAMIARAAQSDAIWPHLLALAWQLLWVAIILRVGVHLFRRHVFKSGAGGSSSGTKKRRLFASS